jgi:diadenosine tetraphosphate (Ap4A) HIT family hydrolase
VSARPRSQQTQAKRKKPKNPPAALPAKPEPGPREMKAIAQAEARSKARDMRFSVKAEANKEGGQHISPHYSGDGFTWRLMDAFGTSSTDFAEMELRRLHKALGNSNKLGADQLTINAALAVVDGIKPENEVEAMLASHMAMTHVLAMQAMSRAHWADMIPEYQAAGNFAIKLSRTFTMQMEALAKLRRGGEQTVRVEHVHVHPGAQAIVGHVSHPGGGGIHPSGGQPHAPSAEINGPAALALVPGAPVWSADEGREPLPVASGERESALQDARRGEG